MKMLQGFLTSSKPRGKRAGCKRFLRLAVKARIVQMQAEVKKKQIVIKVSYYYVVTN